MQCVSVTCSGMSRGSDPAGNTCWTSSEDMVLRALACRDKFARQLEHRKVNPDALAFFDIEGYHNETVDWGVHKGKLFHVCFFTEPKWVERCARALPRGYDCDGNPKVCTLTQKRFLVYAKSMLDAVITYHERQTANKRLGGEHAQPHTDNNTGGPAGTPPAGPAAVLRRPAATRERSRSSRPR